MAGLNDRSACPRPETTRTYPLKESKMIPSASGIAAIWQHCEYQLSPIDGTHSEHRANADIRPAQEFSRKHVTDPLHLFRDRHQFGPLSSSLSGPGHIDINFIFGHLRNPRRLRPSRRSVD